MVEEKVIPLPVVTDDGFYVIAKLDNHKCVPLHEASLKFNLNDLVPVGFQESLQDVVQWSVAKDGPGYLGKELVIGKKRSDELYEKKIAESLEKLMAKAKKHVQKIGAPYFLAESNIEESQYEKHFDENTLIGPGHDWSSHYSYDVTLRIQPLIPKRKS